MIDFSIVVVSYFSSDDLAGLIASADAAAAGATWHATIVNNAPHEPLAPLLPHNDHVSVIEAGANLGYSGGLNLGRAHAPLSRFTVFLNPDLTLHPGSLQALGNTLAGGAEAAVPLIVASDGSRQNSLRQEPSIVAAIGDALFGDSWAGRPQAFSETVRDPRSYSHPRPIEWATGAALAIHTDAADTLGDWDDTLFFMYSEETDYARRIRARGGRIEFEPRAVVEHRAGGSGSSPQLDALLEVNKLRYFRKWHGPVASSVFGLILLGRNLLRPHQPGARAAVRALLSRRTRAQLPGGPR
ncbi:glycosyltransferase family 2 protein [Salinibacterium sp. PAMC 21357]|uniref:glycosyltransferase family 2 protein n=1 Tax=Salinibacterium sp. PAMC 21357 TaxID=1112215 RepID=UPI000287B0BA|nr:glycosyltransferase [Salinibacterium sp. PAMC 21357]